MVAVPATSSTIARMSAPAGVDKLNKFCNFFISHEYYAVGSNNNISFSSVVNGSLASVVDCSVDDNLLVVHQIRRASSKAGRMKLHQAVVQ